MTFTLPWTRIVRAVFARHAMRLGRAIESYGSRKYPWGLDQDLRVHHWLRARIEYPRLASLPKPGWCLSETIQDYKVKKFGDAIGDNVRKIDWHAAAVQTAQKFMSKRGQYPCALDTDATIDNGFLVDTLLRILGLPAFGPLPIVVMLWKGRDGEGGAQVMSVRGGEG